VEVILLKSLISDRVRVRQPRHYRKHRRHADATLRAFTGAKLLLNIPIQPKNRGEAAKWVASTPAYIAAATTVLEAEAPGLVEDVLQGHVSLLLAAKIVRARAKLIKAYRQADKHDRKALGEAAGVSNLFDEAIAPLL
jgi:hypothetical protein